MVRYWYWWAAVIAVVLGCVAPEDPGSTQSESEPIPEGKGQIVIRWKGESTGRTLLGSDWASAHADAYELVLQQETGVRSLTLQAGSGEAVAVDPGTYRLVLLAGVRKTPASSTAYLVGSAWADGVVVTEGQRTGVDLLLRSIDLSLTSAGQAYWKGSLTATASGQTRNPWVGMSLAGTSTTLRPRFKSTELWGGYREAATVTGTPDDWEASVSGTAPATGASLTVGLVGASLCLLGWDGSWVSVSGMTVLTWAWPNRAELAEGHSLIPFTEMVVALGPPPTGIEVGVGWE